jgi:hypothetical protein
MEWRFVVIPVKLRRLLALLFALLPIGLLAAPAYAGDPVIRLVQCNFQLDHNISVAAGSPITLSAGQVMSNRGNLIAFINAATVTMTVDGQAVTPTESEPFLVDPVDNDTWRVNWTYDTIAPAVDQTMVVTFNIVLAHQVVDHTPIELGLAMPGKPAIIPAGPFFTPDLLCNVLGT